MLIFRNHITEIFQKGKFREILKPRTHYKAHSRAS